MKAMILAAGEGTRLRPFTLRFPKPAIPFLGVPLAEYGVHLLDELGKCDLVVNHHHLSDEILRLFQGPAYKHRKVEFSDERAALLGSGGGVHRAKPYLQSEKNFAVINGDEVILPHAAGQIRAAYEDHLSSGRLATIVVTDHPEVGHKFGGVWCNDRNEVQTFSKTPVPLLKGWHYIGILFLASRVFDYFKSEVVEENLLYETLTSAMSGGEKVGVFPIRAEWFETGNPIDFKAATETCLEAMNSEPGPGWALELRKFLETKNLVSPFVEKDEALLVKNFERTIAKFGWRKSF